MLPGFYYHVYNRTINKEPQFHEQQNYDFFLDKFNKYLSNHLDIYAYCLMPNHFHFLIKTKSNGSLSKLSDSELLQTEKIITKSFKDFFITYSKSINKAYNRTGSLFQAHFKKKMIDKESYLANIIAYIHSNPVRSKICDNLQDWKYSSYNSIIGNSDKIIMRNEVLSIFGGCDYFIEFHNNYKGYQKEKEYLYNKPKY
jgi:putative transposase